jgi:hypothetical protein
LIRCLPFPTNGRDGCRSFLRADFALALRLQSTREKAFADGYNFGANRKNLHEMPPEPTGGSSYLSAIGMPVVEPMVTYICALLRVSPSEMLEAAGLLSLRLLNAARKPCRANGRILKEQRPVTGGCFELLSLVKSAASAPSRAPAIQLQLYGKYYFSRLVYCAVFIAVGSFENTELAGTVSAFCFFGFLCSLLRLIWPLAIGFLHEASHTAIRRIWKTQY